MADLALRAQVPDGGTRPERDGQSLYLAACAACHGSDGRGVDRNTVGFEIPLPDFTDCRFASREPDADWMAIGIPADRAKVEREAFWRLVLGKTLSEGALRFLLRVHGGFLGGCAGPGRGNAPLVS